MTSAHHERDTPLYDAVVVGAGFAGLYLLHRLRSMGFTARAVEAADDVGGTWYWNRYPGARCDIPTTDYTYSFDPQLEADWEWSEKYATQPEILSYLQHVAERYNLRRDISFSTRVTDATWHPARRGWSISTDQGTEFSARYYIMATGCLSMPKEIDIDGADRFAGEIYSTSRWPRDEVDLVGKRVAVIGTGSSGVQTIPAIADTAAELTVYQRTPNFSMPALHGPPESGRLAELAADRAGYRERAKRSVGGVTMPPTGGRALDADDATRTARYEAAWAAGHLLATRATFSDLITNPVANATLAEFARAKIRAQVDDPVTAEALCPTDHPFGTKRPCLDDGYYTTFNRPHVSLIDLRSDPINTITETGIETTSGHREFDVLVYATGFDALTGAIVAVDIEGRDGDTLARKWSDGPHTYLGLMSVGFPNLFLVTGPGSPSVLSNMAVSIEQHVEWITDCLGHMRERGFDTIEPTPLAETSWGTHVDDCADITLYPQANSWYLGSNVPGKPRRFLPYIGGVGAYRKICEDVVARDYLGFSFDGPSGGSVNDGVAFPLQPDVKLVLDAIAAAGLPPLDALQPDQAREQWAIMRAAGPPGPDVGAVIDGELPGPVGSLRYRLFRPAGDGPHPALVYFHGGGWVLGDHTADGPLCRDLCVRADMAVVSVGYRHAPEAPFPAAVDDACAALDWVAAHADELGIDPTRISVGGWSAGGNLAAVAAQYARDSGGPSLVAQLLINPVVDGDLTRSSYVDNASGFILTTDLMRWFWSYYADPADRTDPRAAPIRAADLSELPPALIVTCEFDPLSDEGAAYAGALEAAGNATRHLAARGQIHTSVTMVDIVLSGAPIRADIAAFLRSAASRMASRTEQPMRTSGQDVTTIEEQEHPE